MIGTQINDNFAHFKYNRLEKSAIAAHCIWTLIKLLDQIVRTKYLNSWKSYYIKSPKQNYLLNNKDEPILNSKLINNFIDV